MSPRRLTAWWIGTSKGLALGVLVALAAGIVAWSMRVPDDGAIEAARRAIQERRYDDAATVIDEWLGSDPDSAEAHALKARVALNRGQLSEALDAMEHAESLGYPREALNDVRGRLLAAAGRLDEAEPLLRKALEAEDGPAPEVAKALAEVGIRSFRFGTAMEALERWIRDDSCNPEPYLRRIEVRKRAGAEPDTIIADAQAVLACDPQNLGGWKALAESLQSASRLDEANRAYQELLELDPDDPDALVGAARNAQVRGEAGQAAAFLDRSLAVDPDLTVALVERARLDLARGDADRALERLERAQRLEPDDPEIHYRRALALERLGRSNEAEQARAASEKARRDSARLAELRDILVRHPENLDAQADLARWMIEHDHVAEGLQWAEKVLRVEPGHMATCRLLAEHYQRTGQAAMARFYRSRVPDEEKRDDDGGVAR